MPTTPHDQHDNDHAREVLPHWDPLHSPAVAGPGGTPAPAPARAPTPAPGPAPAPAPARAAPPIPWAGHTTPAAHPAPAPHPTGRQAMRIGDRERYAVAQHLTAACAAGLITQAEFDQRVTQAWHAVIRADLDPITADLPAHIDTDTPTGTGATPAQTRAKIRAALHTLTLVWLSLNACTFVVWGLLCITGEQLLYPWWLWFFAPPGAILAVLWRTTRRPPQHP